MNAERFLNEKYEDNNWRLYPPSRRLVIEWLQEYASHKLKIIGYNQQRELLSWMEEKGNFNIHNSLDIDEIIDGFTESKT